jgi:glycosyltransferase involved in cell wall biosynthesis
VVRDDVDGLLVPPRDPAALAGAVARLLDDAALAAELATAGPERAAAFDWGVVVARIEACYRRAAEAPPRSLP